MNKLIVVIMGPGKEEFLKMCLESVKDADKVLYWTSDLSQVCEEDDTFYNEWDKTDPATNGKCRQRYLNHLKETYPDDWCLVLDEDEILEEGGIEAIRLHMKERELGLYNVKMRHFIGDLGHEDNTRPVHIVPCRLFKISEAIKYPEHSHPVLEGELMGACLDTTIFHLGHLPIEYLDYIQKRYKQHSTDSIVHTQDFLKNWYYAHLFGQYPKKEINLIELPKQILDRYGIDKDEFYFISRKQIEAKHFIMMSQWLNYSRAITVLDFGCGFGLYGLAGKLINPGLIYTGVEISKYVNDNWNDNIGKLINEDIRKISINEPFELVLFIDILEHLPYEDLDKVLENECKRDSKFIFSIPFEGDPNLEADPTHIIKEDKKWWVNKLSQYFNIKDAPQDWLFHEQLLIGEKNETNRQNKKNV